ncbi:hypothetical protein DPMN_111381 [Dreissena polymorpha]|uniref:Uncharacterized protein n=1 Tax=Dreissena polymorpha TaxID=45954 RepID=A0A9D4QNR9_DREPO|nr:hypothetical protein DPMN_111381 [Dreissena polymorpha]
MKSLHTYGFLVFTRCPLWYYTTRKVPGFLGCGRSSWNQQIIFHYLTRLHEINQQTYDQFPVRVQQQTCMKVGFCHKAREQWMGLSYP